MKKLSEIYKPYMIRPIFYKTVTKSTTGLAAVLVWNRWSNKEALVSLDYGFYIIGVVMLSMSWFNYLSLDGVDGSGIKNIFASKEIKKENKHKIKHGMDFIDEKVVSFDELEEDERTVCKMASNLISGGILLLAAIVEMIIYH